MGIAERQEGLLPSVNNEYNLAYLDNSIQKLKSRDVTEQSLASQELETFLKNGADKILEARAHSQAVRILPGCKQKFYRKRMKFKAFRLSKNEAITTVPLVLSLNSNPGRKSPSISRISKICFS